MASNRIRSWCWVVLGLSAALGMPVSCQKDSPVQPSPEAGSRISVLQVDRIALAPGDSTAVRAAVVAGAEPGTPSPGVAVSFSRLLERPSGTFNKATALSDAQGWASALFIADPADTGQVVLKVTAGASVKYVTLRVTGGSGDGEPAALTLACTTEGGVTGIAADGRSDLELTVRAVRGVDPEAGLGVRLTAGDRFQDLNGNGFFDGADQVVPDGDRNGDGQWEGEGTLPDSVTTDGLGAAQFDYRAGTTVGPVYIRMTGGGASRELIVTQHALDLQLTVTPEIRELLADGISEAPVTIRILDWSGAGVGGVLVKCVAGEPFSDTGLDGFYTPGTDAWQDDNGNGRWDALGTISSVATTSATGAATVTYRAGLEPGPVTVRVTTTGGSAQAAISLVPLPPAGGLALALDAATLPADGASTVQGTVSVTDGGGLPQAGKRVLLSAGSGSIAPSVVTGADGSAGFTYTAGSDPGTVQIEASVDGITRRAAIELVRPVEVCRVVIQTALSEIAVSGTGGNEQTAVRAQCFDCSQNPVGAGLPVRFRITGGPGGGERFTECLCDDIVRTTDAGGVAAVTLASGTISGTVLIEAVATGPTPVTAAARVGIAAGPPALIAVGVEKCNVEACNTVNVTNNVVVLVRDAQHNPVRDGTAVHVWCDPDGMVVGSDGQGTSIVRGGLASAAWHSDGSCGVITIHAETDGGAVRGQSSFLASGLPATARFASPALPEISMPADGSGTVDLEAEFLDANANFLVPWDVEFAAQLGAISGVTQTGDGCYSSIADAVYTAPVLGVDGSYTVPDDGVGGTDLVSVSAGHSGVGDTFTVVLLTGPASAANSSIDLAGVPPNSQTYFSVLVKDASGNPLGGHLLSITASGGTIDAAGTTNASGVAGGLSFRAPGVGGPVLVEVRDMDPARSGNMVLRKTITIGN